MCSAFRPMAVEKACAKRKAKDSDSKTLCIEMLGDRCDIVDTSTYRSGLLTSRMRPCSVPRSKLTRYYRMQLEDSERHPDFVGIPAWLKPFLHHYNQMGCRAERLCHVFRNLPDDLLTAIRTACTTVVVLVLHRMMVAKETASHSLICEEDTMDRMEDEQWLYEGFGLSDDELDTFDQADFGVLRYVCFLSCSHHFEDYLRELEQYDLNPRYELFFLQSNIVIDTVQSIRSK
jgi:hypothetical protein